MVRYELKTILKIAEICSSYGKHRRWLEAKRELAKLEKQWESLSFAQKLDENLIVNKRRAELDDIAVSPPNFWIGMPLEPNFIQLNEPIVLSQHDVHILNGGENYEALNNYLVSWLLDKIGNDRGVKPVTGRIFIERSKQYNFFEQLLPQERVEFNSLIDRFLAEQPQFVELQLNVIVPANPSSGTIEEAGKKIALSTKAFEVNFLTYLKSIGWIDKIGPR